MLLLFLKSECANFPYIYTVYFVYAFDNLIHAVKSNFNKVHFPVTATWGQTHCDVWTLYGQHFDMSSYKKSGSERNIRISS